MIEKMSIRYKKRSIAIDDELWEQTEALAKACNMSISSYIRFLLKLKRPRESPGEDFWKVYYELHKIGVNINQMAKLANGIGIVDYENFKEDVKMIKSMRKRLFDEHLKSEEILDGISRDKTI